MSPNIYLIDENRGLVEMREQRYDSEDILQKLLADHPALLAGESDVPRERASRWALVRREASIAEDRDGHGRWSLDHLFLDAAGVPTLVEVKRSTDTRIRREMIGQMLDYAAHAVTSWTGASVLSDFEMTCATSGREPGAVMAELLGEDGDVEAFWAAVQRNLEAGRVRMVFVADEIPREVRRVVEFLNDQMSPAEVLAIEVKQFVDPVHGLKTLVPRPVGQSVKALERKGDSALRGPKRTWTEADVIAELTVRFDTEIAAAATKVIRTARQRGLSEGFIGGPKQGSIYFEIDALPAPARFLFVHSSGQVGFGFGRLAQVAPFESLESRLELANMLERIDGFKVKNPAGGPALPLGLLVDDAAVDIVFEVVDYVVRRCREAKLG